MNSLRNKQQIVTALAVANALLTALLLQRIKSGVRLA